MAQHHCVASASLAHLSTASAATQQPGCCAFHIAARMSHLAHQDDHACSSLPVVSSPAEECLQISKDLVNDSYVLKESEFLALPGQRDSRWTYHSVVACSYPSPQHNPGKSSKLANVTVLQLKPSCFS